MHGAAGLHVGLQLQIVHVQDDKRDAQDEAKYEGGDLDRFVSFWYWNAQVGDYPGIAGHRCNVTLPNNNRTLSTIAYKKTVVKSTPRAVFG